MLQNLEMSAAPLPRPHLLRLRLGLAVWSIRQARHLTQSQLACRLKTSRQHVSNIERAEKLPTVETMLRLCEVLRVKPATLLRLARL